MTVNATFSISSNQCITGALQQLGVLAKGEVADSNDLADCLVFLQAMLKFWDTQGKKAWLYQTIQFSCVPNKASYVIGNGGDLAYDRPIAITQAYSIDGNQNKQPLIQLSKQQFEMLTPSNAPGPAVNFFYDAVLPAGVFYMWQVPTDNSRAYGIVVQRPIADLLNSGAATFDVPQEGYLALIFGLAALVGRMYGVEEKTLATVRTDAATFLEVFTSFAEEEASITFQPSTQGRYGRG